MRKSIFLCLLLSLMATTLQASTILNLPYLVAGQQKFQQDAIVQVTHYDTKYRAVELKGIAKSGHVYYLIDAKRLLFDNVNIDLGGAVLVYAFDETDVRIWFNGYNVVKANSLVITGGECSVAGDSDMKTVLNLYGDYPIIAGKHVAISFIRWENDRAKYVISTQGQAKTTLTLESVKGTMRSTVAVFKNVKDINTVRCGLKAESYYDQRMSFDRKECVIKQYNSPLKSLTFAFDGNYFDFDTSTTKDNVHLITTGGSDNTKATQQSSTTSSQQKPTTSKQTGTSRQGSSRRPASSSTSSSSKEKKVGSGTVKRKKKVSTKTY